MSNFDIPAARASGGGDDLGIAVRRLQLEEQRQINENLKDFGKGLGAIASFIKNEIDKKAISDMNKKLNQQLSKAKSAAEKIEIGQRVIDEADLNPRVKEQVQTFFNERVGSLQKAQAERRASIVSGQEAQIREQGLLTKRIELYDLANRSNLLSHEEAVQAAQTMAEQLKRQFGLDRKNEIKLQQEVKEGHLKLDKINDIKQLFEEIKIKGERDGISKDDIKLLDAGLGAAINVTDPDEIAGQKLQLIANEFSSTPDELIGRAVRANPKITSLPEAYDTLRSIFEKNIDKHTPGAFGLTGQKASTDKVFLNLPDIDPQYSAKLNVLTKAFNIQTQDDKDQIIAKLNSLRESNPSSFGEIALKMRPVVGGTFGPDFGKNDRFNIVDEKGNKLSLEEFVQRVNALPQPPPSPVRSVPQSSIQGAQQDLLQQTQNFAQEQQNISFAARGNPEQERLGIQELQNRPVGNVQSQLLPGEQVGPRLPHRPSGPLTPEQQIGRLLGQLLAGNKGPNQPVPFPIPNQETFAIANILASLFGRG